MKEIQTFLELQEIAGQLITDRPLTTQERGNLAMAARWLSARPEAEQAAAKERIRRTVRRGHTSAAFLLLLDMAYADFTDRGAVTPEEKQDAAFFGTVYRLKCEAARGDTLRDFVLTARFRDYPEFFRVYQAMIHGGQEEV